MSFICMRLKDDFHIKGWALNLVLKQRPAGTRKWPIVITPGIESPLFRYSFVPCRSNESKAYPLTLGDDIFDIYCVMAEAPTEKKQVRSWWMDAGYEDWWKKCIRTSNIAHFINGNWTEWSAIWSQIIPVRGVASFSTSSRPGWLSLPHILKIARMTSPHWPRQHFELKAPSTRIRRFLYPQIFLCGYKNICVHT